MTDQPIDPAATPDDDDAPQIAADDAGASAAAERLGRENDESAPGRDATDDPAAAPPREGMAGDGV